MAETAPTFSEVYGDYVLYADYEETASVTSAKKFVTACRRLIAMRAKRSRLEGISETEFDVASIHQEMSSAKQWLSENDTSLTAGSGGNTGRVGFSGWRD